MRRILLSLATTLTITTIAILTPTTALAADSTCSTHQLAAVNWGIADDHFTHSGDFQCGGANNEDYYVEVALQYKTSSGSWNTYACPNGYLGLCVGFHPATGWENGGQEITYQGTFNPSSPQLDCHTVRLHATVKFRGSSPDIAYNSLTYGIGGC